MPIDLNFYTSTMSLVRIKDHPAAKTRGEWFWWVYPADGSPKPIEKGQSHTYEGAFANARASIRRNQNSVFGGIANNSRLAA